VRDYLAEEGFCITDAADEQTAWQMAQVAPPETAVLDIILPATPTDPVPDQFPFGIRLIL
jgi:DNA-binding response OmpR family regulator